MIQVALINRAIRIDSKQDMNSIWDRKIAKFRKDFVLADLV